MDLVKAIEDRTTASVLEFIDGTKVSVKQTVAEMLTDMKVGAL
jgi:hypothetical protein